MHGCTQDVTVWNRWRDPANPQAGDVFYRHILPVQCKYKTRVYTNATTDGVIIKNTQIVIIPVSEKYCNPSEWSLLDEDGRKEYFTLRENDIVALGIIKSDITGVAPLRESDVVNRLKPNVFTIGAVRDSARDGLGRHFRVEGV